MSTVYLTNVGVTPEGNGIGTDPSGFRVEFHLSESDRTQLKKVLYGDLAGNFVGVEVDTEDLVS